MKQRDSNTISLWQDIPLNSYPSPSTDANKVYDVLIVGAGITGLTTAILLQRAGKKCMIAEGKTVGFGTTGGTTAHINTFFDTSYHDIATDFGQDAAKLIANAATDAFSLLKNLIDTEHIDCDFEYKDAYVYAEEEKETKELVKILAATREAGINAVEVRENMVPVPFQMAMLITEQGQFHPLKYIDHLAKVFIDAGGIITEHTFIDKTELKDGVHIASSRNLTIKATNIVYATHMPPGINSLDFKCAPYRSYVLGIKLKNDAYPDALVYDMQEPYHYFRTHVVNGQKYLILGGEDHKTAHDDPEQAFAELAAYAAKYYNIASIDYRWSAQYYVPADGLPYIGQLPAGPENIYIATGYSGNGMTYGTLAAIIISDQILGVENPYAELLSPSRIKPIAGFEEFVKENADVAFHYIADRLSVDAIESLGELEPGNGKVLNYKKEKLAIYKAEDGTVTALSPYCTHAGCIVNFNAIEKSWDCPCHGGRFTVQGEVLTGPPRKNLSPIVIGEGLKQ
ncbi:FAD-dependent oxidoreductase [Pedobacter sp.]|uniref:FAD-dependent oxidoreductase n=1 Tax=Pedobacter sp. TaxID=1411316 RepID=UPI003D7FEA03